MSGRQTVKDTAARVGLPARTLRYYDRVGLVCPRRTESGYRVYEAEDEDKLRLVRRAKTLGFSLREIGELLALAESGGSSQVVRGVERILGGKIGAIDAQVAELGRSRERLVAFGNCREGGLGRYSSHDSLWRWLNDAAGTDDTATVEPGGTSASPLGADPRRGENTVCSERRATAGALPPAHSTSEIDLRGELERFKVELRAAGLSAATVHHYLAGSSRFVRWLAGEYAPASGRARRVPANT